MQKRGVHTGSINCIRSNVEFVAFSGVDSYVTVWRIVGLSLNSKIVLPGSQLSVADMQFLRVAHETFTGTTN